MPKETWSPPEPSGRVRAPKPDDLTKNVRLSLVTRYSVWLEVVSTLMCHVCAKKLLGYWPYVLSVAIPSRRMASSSRVVPRRSRGGVKRSVRLRSKRACCKRGSRRERRAGFLHLMRQR